MDTQDKLLLHLPFDEAAGSDTARDFSAHRHDAKVSGAVFTGGRQGNCIRFGGDGKAEIASGGEVIPLGSDFTLTAWVRTPDRAPGSPARLCLVCNTSTPGARRDAWADATPGEWAYLAVVKTERAATLYMDGKPAATVALPDTLTGLAIAQDRYDTELGEGDLDEVRVYAAALAPERLAREREEQSESRGRVAYSIDGLDLLSLDIHVESSTGVVDIPKLKTPASVDWPDYHGAALDLSAKRVEEREITLNCWVRATGKLDFTRKIGRLCDLLRGDGTARLHVGIHPLRPLVFEVYAPEGVALTKRWHEGKMIGTFALKLREPDPVKRVVRWRRDSDDTKRLTISVATPKMLSVYWGDGEATHDITGGTADNPLVLTHDYKADGAYFAVVAGVIEEITSFETNGVVVWERI